MRPAGNDIIIGAEDRGALDKPDRQVFEKAAQVSACINVDMRCKPVSPGTRQVVDQRDITEVILSPPVEAVRFKRISPVRAEQDQPPTWFQGAYDFIDRGPVILDMLQDFMAQDQVETAVRKGECFTHSVDHPVIAQLCFLQAFEFDVQTDDVLELFSQVQLVHPQTAAVHKRAPFNSFTGSIQDHLQAAALPIPPDVGRFAAQGCFLQVSGFSQSRFSGILISILNKGHPDHDRCTLFWFSCDLKVAAHIMGAGLHI